MWGGGWVVILFFSELEGLVNYSIFLVKWEFIEFIYL